MRQGVTCLVLPVGSALLTSSFTVLHIDLVFNTTCLSFWRTMKRYSVKLVMKLFYEIWKKYHDFFSSSCFLIKHNRLTCGISFPCRETDEELGDSAHKELNPSPSESSRGSDPEGAALDLRVVNVPRKDNSPPNYDEALIQLSDR